MKLKTLIQINEWISHGNAVNRSPDDNLYPTPGGMNDGNPHWDTKASFDVNSSNIAENKAWNEGVGDWDGIIEGKDWFCYVEGNDWHSKTAGASIYITEDDKPHKMWVKFKTHGLRKAGDTNESFKERIRKHSHKVARSWMTAAKDIHKNAGLNEVGNPIPISWKQAFKEALSDPKVKGLVAEKGERELSPIADPVNFTPRVGEANMKKVKISYSAVVLSAADQQKLKSAFEEQMPDGWTTFAHHMTICMGELPTELKDKVGEQVTLTCTDIGTSLTNIALKVSGFQSSNAIPHITLFVNVTGGGKPFDSNKITDWKPLPQPIEVQGVVSEIPFKG